MAANRTLVPLVMDQSWPGQSPLYKCGQVCIIFLQGLLTFDTNAHMRYCTILSLVLISLFV